MSEVDRLVDELSLFVHHPTVLEAMRAVPRERFVESAERDRAYENSALTIGCGQTISQPLVVARMAELLELSPADRVLDVGTGSGYHAAVLARLAAHVWSIERHDELSRGAALSLAGAGVDNVTLIVGDGALGLPAQAPFDAINVAAASARHALDELVAQLAPGGRLVAPLTGPPQRLALARRCADGALDWTLFEEVRFVPLVSGVG